jgi:hypothetical protein
LNTLQSSSLAHATPKGKDYAASGVICNELVSMGLAIKDVAGGRVEVGPA